MKKLLLPLWIIVAFSLFLYSFTQVDLSLTFSQASLFQTVEKWFQYVGWFNRPLSTFFYIAIISFMFVLYLFTLSLIRKKLIEWKTVWKIVICVSVILFFSYNAFSYDLFNYIFDAKILVHYHQNPYLHKALDFPGDPMLSFMHWTQRTYPYGPAWLLITVPVYYIGFGIFSISFYLFKLIMVASYIGSVWLIYRIAKKLELDAVFAAAAFALNPLVLIESLVSAHNDIAMMFFGILGLHLYLKGKNIESAASIVFSILIKFATIFMIPAILAKWYYKLNNNKFLNFLVVLMTAAVIAAIFRSGIVFKPYFNFQFQPWYLLYVLPFAAFIQQRYYVAVPVYLISVGALLQYVPFLYLGNWDFPVPVILNGIMIGSVALSAIFVLLVKTLKIRL